MKPMSQTPVAVVAGLVVASSLQPGCARERRLFDVVLDVAEAEALDGALDRDDVLVLHEVIPDVGDGNGGDGREQTIALDLDPTATRATFTLTVALDDASLTLLGFGRSLTTVLPPEGDTLTVPLLLVPANTVGALTALPPAGGGDGCVTDDGLGRAFIVGGSRSQQGVYLLDNDSIDVLTIAGAGYPAGVGGVGCGATDGVIAVAGGCSGDVDTTVVFRIERDGARQALPTAAIGQACGAAAAARRDGTVWLVDGDQSLHQVSSTGTRDLGTLATGDRTGFEVTADDAAVVLVDGDAFYAAAVVTNLGPHVALGRRGNDVLVLDRDGVISLVENATTRALFGGVAVADVRAFVVLTDDTVVSLRGDGGTIDVRLPDGTTRAIPTTAPGSSRVAARPDGTIVVGGADIAGLLAMGLVR